MGGERGWGQREQSPLHGSHATRSSLVMLRSRSMAWTVGSALAMVSASSQSSGVARASTFFLCSIAELLAGVHWQQGEKCMKGGSWADTRSRRGVGGGGFGTLLATLLPSSFLFCPHFRQLRAGRACSRTTTPMVYRASSLLLEESCT